MKRLLRSLVWRIFGRPDLPPKEYVINLSRINAYTGRVYSTRAHDMYRAYLNEDTIEQIATRHNVTRERVRQCLWKVYREGI